jgi:hypothetical protein
MEDYQQAACLARTLLLTTSMSACAVHVQDNPSLYALWPNGTCSSLGLGGAYNTSLTTMLEAMVNASNPAAVAATINQQLAGLMSGAAGNGSTGAAIADRVRGRESWLAGCAVVCDQESCILVCCITGLAMQRVHGVDMQM